MEMIPEFIFVVAIIALTWKIRCVKRNREQGQ